MGRLLIGHSLAADYNFRKFIRSFIYFKIICTYRFKILNPNIILPSNLEKKSHNIFKTLQKKKKN